MSTTGIFLKGTFNFCDQNLPKKNHDDENPQPPSPNQSSSEINCPKSIDSSTILKIPNEANQAVVENVVPPTKIKTPTSAHIL